MKKMKQDLELEIQILRIKWPMKCSEPGDYPPFMGSSECLLGAPCVLATFLSTLYIHIYVYSRITVCLQQPCVL